MLPLYDNKDVVKKIRKLRKYGSYERKATISWLFLLISIIVAKNMGYIKSVFSDVAVIFSSVIAIMGIGGSNITERNKTYTQELSQDISETTKQECSITSIRDVEIFPKNIQIGENLEAVNIIPVFKNGHYILIHSNSQVFLLRQLEMDGKNDVQILESEEASEILEELTLIGKNTKVRETIKELKKRF